MEDHMRELSIFIDESGNTAINRELYICVGFMIPTAEIDSVFSQIHDIAAKYSNGVIKSSKIRSENTRTKLLQEICGLNFSYVALIVNKGDLDKYPGLKFSGAFYKFLHRKFATFIDSATQYDKLHFNLDTHGTSVFQEGVERYFSARMSSTLFPTVTMQFINDEDNYGIQAADLIAGTLGRCYFYNRDSENADTWLKILDPKCAGHKIFPPHVGNEKELVWGESAEDQAIANCLLKNAYDFLSGNVNSDDEFVQRQCEVLQLLLTQREYVENSYIYSDAIMAYLEERGFEPISKQLFMSKVIGRLRDSRIIITGNANGYRLALSKKDIESYVRHNDAIVSPMIHRLGLATELLKGAFRTDILQNFDNLREFVHAYRHNATLVGTEIDDEQVASAEDMDSGSVKNA